MSETEERTPARPSEMFPKLAAHQRAKLAPVEPEPEEDNGEENTDPLDDVVAPEPEPEPPKAKPRARRRLPNGLRDMPTAPVQQNPVSSANDQDGAVGQSQVMSLRDWLISHNLQAGMKWVRIIRLHPVEFVYKNRPLSVSGIQQDRVHHAFDERWLESYWGGASWQIEVWANSPEKHRDVMIDHRLVSISGDPVAYCIGGHRVPLEPEEDESPNDPRQGWQQPGQWPGQQQQGQFNRFAPPPWQQQQNPMAGLSNMTAEMLSRDRRQKEDVQLLGMIKDSLEASTKAQTETFREQIADLRSSSSGAAAAAQEPAKLIAHVAETTSNAQIASMNQQLEAERNMRSREAEALRNEHSRQIQLLQGESSRNLEIVKSGYEMQLRVAAESRQAAETRAIAAEERASREVDRERQTWQREIDRLREERTKDIMHYKEAYENQTKQLEGQLMARLDIANHEIDRTRGEITAMRAENLALRDKANPDAKTKISEVRDLIALSEEITGGRDQGEPDDSQLPAWERVAKYFAKSSLGDAAARRISGQGQQVPVPQIPQVAPMPQIQAPTIPQFGQPQPNELPQGFTPSPPPQAPQAAPSQAQNPAVPFNIENDADEASRINVLATQLAPAIPILEAAMAARGDVNALVAQALQAVPKEDLADFVESDLEDILAAIERANPNSALNTAGGTRFLKALYRAIEKAVE